MTCLKGAEKRKIRTTLQVRKNNKSQKSILVVFRSNKNISAQIIDLNGNVGEIGGVKYKLKGAVKAKADIFICPYENYDEVMELKNRYNYDIEIIQVPRLIDTYLSLGSSI